jgi:hypothetical protein
MAMPQPNPYEAPQTDLAPAAPGVRSTPLVIKTIFYAQLVCLLLLAIFTPMTVVPASQAWHNLLVSSLVVGLALTTAILIITAVRYRIAWLLLAEWFLFALPMLIYGLLSL